MRIGELSARTGVSRRLLRYYEEQGLLAAERAPNGYRRYAPDAPLAVEQIRSLLSAGLPTGAIRRMLPCVHGPGAAVEPSGEAYALLRAELARIDARLDCLNRDRTALAEYLAATARADPCAEPSTLDG